MITKNDDNKDDNHLYVHTGFLLLLSFVEAYFELNQVSCIV